MSESKLSNGVSLADCKKINRWRIIPIDKLPDGIPVIGIQEVGDKNMAKFYLVEECLIPDFEHPDYTLPEPPKQEKL